MMIIITCDGEVGYCVFHRSVCEIVLRQKMKVLSFPFSEVLIQEAVLLVDVEALHAAWNPLGRDSEDNGTNVCYMLSIYSFDID